MVVYERLVLLVHVVDVDEGIVVYDDVSDDHVQMDVNDDVPVHDHVLVDRVVEVNDDHEQILLVSRIKIILKIKMHVHMVLCSFLLSKMR